MNLIEIFNAIHESVETSTSDEIKHACKLIIDAQTMDSGQRDCIRAAYKNGPLFDGDLPSKDGRTKLVEKGYMSQVVVKGEDGYNALTLKGAQAYRIIEAMNINKQPEDPDSSDGVGYKNIWDKAMREKEIRATRMPNQESALIAMFEAFVRLKELGWKEIIYCPKNGEMFSAIEPGSTGIHKCKYGGIWPDGKWWIYSNDVWPANPILWKEINDKLTEK